MQLLENAQFQQDLSCVTSLDLPWEKLAGRSIMISGATGMIGSTLIHVLMKKNREEELGCRIYALGRSSAKGQSRFPAYWGDPKFSFIECNIDDADRLREAFTDAGLLADPEADEKDKVQVQDGYPDADGRTEKAGERPGRKRVDYVFHAASNTHPVAYATDPIGTVVTNVIGLNNLLSYAAEAGVIRFAYASSNEIYGENRGDVDLFDESYCGYIDCNTMRAGYPESKRAGEALCQAYIRQKNLDVVIPRFTRTFGPTMLMSDTKAISQFIRKSVLQEDIVLKSAGTQNYSYTYVCDAVSGLLTVLLKGRCGEAYNIAARSCDITLRDLAGILARQAGRKVVFEIPDETEAAGYSRATKALLDSRKLEGLGWRAAFDMETGLAHTVDILRELT